MTKGLDVVKFPAAILREKAKKIEDFNSGLVELAEKMSETMYFYRGIGLAANQVGDLRRIFVLDVLWREPSEEEKKVEKSPEVFINPELLHREGHIEYEEGCLSIPKVYGIVKRSEFIRVKFQDLKGVVQEAELSGLKAIAFQHELDHLDGILFLDHLSAFKRRSLIEKYTKMQLDLAKEEK